METKRVIGVAVGSLLLIAALVATFSSGRPTSVSQTSTDAATQLSSSAQCTQDTGGTCILSDCYPWRKHTTCSWGTCVCPANMCAYQGSCVSRSDLPPPPSPPVCESSTGETCYIFSCGSGAKCSGVTFGFSTGFSSQCLCPAGSCAVGGACVASPKMTAPPQNLNAKSIVCPVLASLYNAGILKPDAYGRVERLKVQAAIKDGLNADDTTAWFFGQTTAGYTAADVDETNFMMEPISTSLEMKKDHATQEPPGGDRYLNIFQMGRNPDIMHQIAAAVRGGQGIHDPQCSTYPCLARFTEFFARFADSRGRIYTKQLGDIAGNIYENGFHGVAADTTLFTGLLGFTGREFAALAGFLACFGHKDESQGGALYLTVDDIRTMEMSGVFPAGWTPPSKEWGTQNVLDTLNAWRIQGVKGLSASAKLQTVLRALAQGATQEIAALLS